MIIEQSVPARGRLSETVTNRAQLRKIWKHTFKGRAFQDPAWRETLQAMVQIKASIKQRTAALDRA